MTCIVGLVHNNKVYIGADSSAVSGWQVRATKLDKVFRKGPFLIAYTDSFRMGQILRYHLDVQPQDGETDIDYMVRHFVDAIRTRFKELGFAKVENNEESGGMFLVGYRGHLYAVESDFQVNEMADGFDSWGCGSDYALGAMKALEHLPPIERITKALEISAHFSGGVLPPFQIDVLDEG